jgi:hypothetical protein
MKKSVVFEHSVTAENPMPREEFLQAERILARLVAEAFSADHPEIVGETYRNVNIIGGRRERRPTHKD